MQRKLQGSAKVALSPASLPSVKCTHCKAPFHSSPATPRSFLEVSSQSTTTNPPRSSTGAAPSPPRSNEAAVLYLRSIRSGVQVTRCASRGCNRQTNQFPSVESWTAMSKAESLALTLPTKRGRWPRTFGPLCTKIVCQPQVMYGISRTRACRNVDLVYHH